MSEPSPPSPLPRGRWIAELRLAAPLAVIIAIVAGGGHAVATEGRADDHHQVAVATMTVQGELSRLAALDAGANGATPDPSTIEATLDALDQALASASLTGENSRLAAELTAHLRPYRQVVAGQVTGLDAPTQPRRHQRYENLAAQLSALVDEARERADAADDRAQRDLIIAASFAGLAVLAILALEGRSRSERSLDRARDEHARRYQALVENLASHIYVIDAEGMVEPMSPLARRAFGSEVARLDILLDRFEPRDRADLEYLLSCLDDNGPEVVAPSMNRTYQLGSGRWFELTFSDHRADPVINGIVLTAEDVTQQMELESKLRRQATEDELTGLLNRRALNMAVEDALARPERQVTTTLMMIDLDGFKEINDTKGHPVGDTLLAEVARRLRMSTRSKDQVARLGGDEFAILIEFPADAGLGAVEQTAARIVETFRSPFKVDQHLLTVHASIGISTSAESPSADLLLRHADIALYQAKQRGGKQWSRFSPEMEEVVLAEARVLDELRAAIGTRELHLVYQPLISVADGRPVGFEALLQWENQRLGDVNPELFIPLAEQTGLIVGLGRWLLSEACHQLAQWQEEHRDQDLTMSINVSVVELAVEDYTIHLAEIIRRTGIDPASLQLEVTESMVANDTDAVVDQLEEIRSLGVRVALDDFGTGYSSMSQLNSLPVDCVKIDRSFIHAMIDDRRASAMVQALIGLARALDLTIVAEGVETYQQLDALREPDCDQAQGHLLAGPMPAGDVATFLASRRDETPI